MPIYDVPSSIDILTTGSYFRLPLSIESSVPNNTSSGNSSGGSGIQSIIHKLNEVVQLRLLDVDIPSQFSSITVSNGRAIITVKEEFEVTLTVMGERSTDPWRILNLNILTTNNKESMIGRKQIIRLTQLVQSRIIAIPNPFKELYQIIRK